MKVVQLLPELNEGGVERGVVEFSRELLKRGHESIVISAGGKLAAQIEADGGRRIMLDVCSKNLLSAYGRVQTLRELLREIKPDIIHARSRVPAWLAYLANRKLHIPFVTTVHGFNSVSPYSKIMTQGDRVICVSGAIKTYIQAHYHTPEGKITVIPRGIDLEKFNPENVDTDFIQAFRQQYGLEGKMVVATVGRITQLKDLETFIGAVAELKRTYPNIAGLIVGGVREDKEAYFASLKALVKEKGVEQEIRFAGSQSHVAEIYALSDVVVSSAKKPESFGRSVAEAIAMNTPVVATGHGGVLDIVAEGENGFFYPPEDAASLTQGIVQAKALQFDGYGYVKSHFSLTQMVEKTLGVYHDLV